MSRRTWGRSESGRDRLEGVALLLFVGTMLGIFPWITAWIASAAFDLTFDQAIWVAAVSVPVLLLPVGLVKARDHFVKDQGLREERDRLQVENRILREALNPPKPHRQPRPLDGPRGPLP